MYKSGATGTIAYSLYVDGDEVKTISVDTTKYTFRSMLSDAVILQKKNDAGLNTNTIAVWDHAGKEVGTFDKGDNESLQFYGSKWIISVDTVAGNYYFY